MRMVKPLRSKLSSCNGKALRAESKGGGADDLLAPGRDAPAANAWPPRALDALCAPKAG